MNTRISIKDQTRTKKKKSVTSLRLIQRERLNVVTANRSVYV